MKPPARAAARWAARRQAGWPPARRALLLLATSAVWAAAPAGAQTPALTEPAGAQAPAPTASPATSPATASATAPIRSPVASEPAAAAARWTVAGAQGLVRAVIVPVPLARDKAAYVQQVAQLCEPERTCFLNFYANPAGLPEVLPLADGIEQQATAVYRRSAKQGAERFIWSCKLGVAGEPCF